MGDVMDRPTALYRGLVLALAVLPAAAPAQLPETVARVAAQAPFPAGADTDGDRVSDDFEAELLAAPAGAVFDVIVRTASGDAGAAQSVVGPFMLRRALPIISGFAGTMTVEQALALAADTSTVRVDRDGAVVLTTDGGRADFGADRAALDYGVTGAGIGICVIDSGADGLHEQLDGTPGHPKIVAWLDLISGLLTPYDDHSGGHGTHVASIAAGDGAGGPLAARYRGVAPGADLYVVKAFPGTLPDDIPQVSPASTQESLTIAGIQWCANWTGVRILSMSFTKTGPTDGSDPLGAAVDAAVAMGKVAVAAAGNDGPNLSAAAGNPGFLGSPGAAASSITVGATAEWSLAPTDPNRSEGPFLPPFSSRGPTLDGRLKPDVVAPGHSVRAALAGTAAGYQDKSGTSMATPFVSGAMALALERNPALTATDLGALAQATAIDRGAPGKDADWGAGMIDVFGLVARADGSAVYAPTPFPAHEVVTGATPFTHSFVLGPGDLAIPIAATVLIDGGPDPATAGMFWSPDLQVELRDPNGVLLDLSQCPLLPDANDCIGHPSGYAGRQELVHALPTLPGTYTITVSAAAGVNGAFLMDLSHGPVAAVLPEPCTKQWTGMGDGSSWLDGGNWSGGTAPLPTDFVCVPAAGTPRHALGATVVAGALVDGHLTVAGGALDFADAAHPSVIAGRLTLATGAALSAASELSLTGLLDGGGTLAADLANSGDVLPGGLTSIVGGGSTPGVLTVSGRYTQSLGGTFSVDVAGLVPALQHDQLLLGDDAALGGTLSITTAPGFTPLAGNAVSIVDVGPLGTRSGAFDDLFGAAISGTLAWQVDYATAAPDVQLRAGPTGGAGGDVTLCHKPGTPAQKTMTLPKDAADAHKRSHGDRDGAC